MEGQMIEVFTAHPQAAQLGLASAPGTPRDTFDAIYERYHPQIYRLLRARLRDPDEAADLAQETFLKAYRAFGTFGAAGAGENVGAWLARIAANAAHDRDRRWRPVASVPWDAAHAVASAAPGDNPEAALLGAEECRAALCALGALTPRCRRAFLLHERDGLSCAAIGALLGATPGAVRGLICRARRDLRTRRPR
jgi:RNA polymerase sigma-70 factor (ECF subfamily)